jgi:hypothetical protein
MSRRCRWPASETLNMNRHRQLDRPHPKTFTDSEVERHSRRVRSTPMNRHRQTGPTGPLRANQRAGPDNERDRQLRRPYFRIVRPCSRTSALYRSIWPASLVQLEEIFFRTSASCLLCASFTRRRHSAACNCGTSQNGILILLPFCIVRRRSALDHLAFAVRPPMSQ